MIPPEVFKIKSSTSKDPTLVSSCMISIIKLSKNVMPNIQYHFLSLDLNMGIKNPKGINASTLPNKLARNARIPTTSLYI